MQAPLQTMLPLSVTSAAQAPVRPARSRQPTGATRMARRPACRDPPSLVCIAESFVVKIGFEVCTPQLILRFGRLVATVRVAGTQPGVGLEKELEVSTLAGKTTGQQLKELTLCARTADP